MDQGPLVTEQIDAGARFLGEFKKYCPIQTAFWLKDSKYGHWYLYVASEQITDENFDLAYSEVIRIWQALGDPLFDPFQVKVIGADHPLARFVMDMRKRFPGPVIPRFRGDGEVIGTTEVEEIYVYPLPIAVPAA